MAGRDEVAPLLVVRLQLVSESPWPYDEATIDYEHEQEHRFAEQERGGST